MESTTHFHCSVSNILPFSITHSVFFSFSSMHFLDVAIFVCVIERGNFVKCSESVQLLRHTMLEAVVLYRYMHNSVFSINRVKCRKNCDSVCFRSLFFVTTCALLQKPSHFINSIHVLAYANL